MSCVHVLHKKSHKEVGRVQDRHKRKLPKSPLHMQNCCWLIKPTTFFDVLACSHTLYYFFSLEIVESTYENKNCGVFFFSRDVEFSEKKNRLMTFTLQPPSS